MVALQLHKSVHFKVLKSNNLDCRNALKKNKIMFKDTEGRNSGMSILAIQGIVFYIMLTAHHIMILGK